MNNSIHTCIHRYIEMVSEMMNMDRINLRALQTLIMHILYYFKFNFICFARVGGMSDRERDHNLKNAMTLLALPKTIYPPSVSVPIFLSYDKYVALLIMILSLKLLLFM